MANVIFELSVPLFERHLRILGNLLERAEVSAKERGIEPAALISARLFPDMFPLSRQVRAACDTAKRTAARLIGLETPPSEDTDKTFTDLQQRIHDAIGYLESHSAERFAGSEQRKIEFPFGSKTVALTSRQYLTRFALPNFYFHITTAYDILRHNGIDIGKRDFLGSLPD